MTSPATWLPIDQAARAAGISPKALRRRIERGTVESEMRADGRRHVHVESIHDPTASPPRGDGGPGFPAELEPLARRLEELAADNGRLRALTEVAESTEQRLADEIHEQRARAQTAEGRVTQLEQLERDLADAGPFAAWRLARQRRRLVEPAA